MADILTQIVDQRRADLAKLGVEFGIKIPSERSRKVHQFLPQKGVILEVKRASPSKGDIAPNLDSAATALSYAQAGAAAISCLTETNYFKGTLCDLMSVCSAVDKFESETGKTGPAVLRKDFLLNEDEVEVAYRAGADAVLLIARILDTQTIIKMAQVAASYKMTSLVEVRTEDDVKKLSEIVQSVNKNYIACGVNSRDLANFTIDLLTPSAMLKKIREVLGQDARVIFESGIRTPQAAFFAGSLGFAGMLLGEAAAKNPEVRSSLVSSFVNAPLSKNGEFWNKFVVQKKSSSSRPLVKICGITQVKDALCAAELGADFLGFILYPKSKRNTNSQFIKNCSAELEQKFGSKKPYLVGVVADFNCPEYQTALNLTNEGILDAVQIHGFELSADFAGNTQLAKIPHYCAVNISNEEDIKKIDTLSTLGEPRILIDAQSPVSVGGTGISIDKNLVEKVRSKHKLWLAGGVSAQNVQEIIKNFAPELIDISSSVESEPGKKDLKKLKEFFDRINGTF